MLNFFSFFSVIFIIGVFPSNFYAQNNQQSNLSSSFITLQEKKIFLNEISNPTQKTLVRKNLLELIDNEIFLKNSVEGIKSIFNENSKQGFQFLHDNIRIAKKDKIVIEKIIGYSDLSFAHFKNSHKDSCSFYAKLLLSELKRQKNQELLFMFFSFHADILVANEDLVEAIEKKLQISKDALKEKNYWFVSKSSLDIAAISIVVGNYELAKQYLDIAKLNNQKLNDSYVMDQILVMEQLISNKTNAQVNQSTLNQVKSRLMTKEDLDLFSLLALVEMQLKDKEYNKIINELENDKLSISKMDIYNIQANLNRILAQSYYSVSKKEQALFYAKKAVENWSPNPKENNLGIQLVTSILKNQGEILLANDFFENYIGREKVNIFNKKIQKIQDLAEANLREIQLKEKEENEKKIEKQRLDIEKEKLEKNRIAFESERKIIIVVVSLLFTLLGIGILLLRIRVITSRKKQKEAELSQTILRSQMNPHFVFNAMSVIQSYIYSNETEKSSTFLVNFSRLMRLILENSSKELIPIELEREILEKYIIAQKMRFQDRFDYELIFDDELIENRAMIPPMISQPFVENSIEHGQLHNIDQGKITIHVFKQNNILVIEISDNGVGRNASSATKKIKGHKSMAINITKERIGILNKKYKSQSDIKIEDLHINNTSGTKVIIKLPLIQE